MNGKLAKITEQTEKGKNTFVKKVLIFKTGEEDGNHMKTVRISFENTGSSEVVLDDSTAKKH